MTGAYSFLIAILFSFTANAEEYDPTHLGEMTFKLTSISARGKRETVDELNAKASFSWDTNEAVVRAKNLEVSLTFDRTRDAINSDGTLLMKQLPQLQFSAQAIESIVVYLGNKEKRLRGLLSLAMRKHNQNFPKGELFPLYRFVPIPGEVEPEIYSAFAKGSAAYSEKTIQITEMSGETLELEIRAQKFTSVKGAFNVIGNQRVW